MTRLSILFFISLCLFALITNAASDRSEEAGVYIVYMGGKGSSTPGTLRADQARLMNFLSERNAMVQVFKHGFTRFDAHMSKDEANLITRELGVVSVFPDKELKLHTTRSWSFLKLQHYLGNPIPATELHSSTANGADTIIGLIDSGVWLESKSFNDGHGSHTSSTIDRHVYANVVLGTNQVIKGGGIYDDLARDRLPGSLDISKVKGRIVLCFNEISSVGDKIQGIITQGVRGLIMVDDDAKIESDLVLIGDLTFPFTSIGSKDGNATLKYIQSNRNPTTTIRSSATSSGYKLEPIVTLFSSRGPSYLSHNLLKPDITAPGVNIIAAWSKMNTEFALPGQAPPDYVVIFGTSMTTPHIDVVAALTNIGCSSEF
ncbi:hypothetical protein POM88_041946 [Heracleum sosnowskyi]|uniref:Uncharacterized protein n=1 Tax=Heracleum sosnowskyi TaxID=360622 RepID=A0AAD8HHS4_9APIA|nr:hypothetical protein POM88_041946 [Heracleum sosnowskyi]